MTQSERWAFAVRWVEEHSRIIRGYVRNHHLLDYSAYEMDDFISEAYLVAYATLKKCGDNFESWFWNLFKNRCKTLANQPHSCKFINACDMSLPTEDKVEYDEKTIEHYLSILTPKQRAAFNEPETLNISRQALQQRINGSLRAIQTLKQSESIKV